MSLSPSVVLRSPIHEWHTARGARFEEVGGWQIPSNYGDAEAEVTAARTTAAVADVSAFAKLLLVGPGVARARGDDGGLIGIGQATVCAPVQSALACRLTSDRLLLLGSAPGIAALQEGPARLGVPRNTLQRDATCAHASFWLFGPAIEQIAARLTSLDVTTASFAPGACAETGFATLPALLVRPPDAGLPSLRLCVAWDVGLYVWERLFECGRGVGLVPLGHAALQRLLRGPLAA